MNVRQDGPLAREVEPTAQATADRGDAGLAPGLLGDEAGFTVIELMVSVVAALVLAGALMSFLISSIHAQDGISSRSISVRQAELGFAQLTRDLREAQNLPDSAGALANGVVVGNDSPVIITYTTGSSAHFTATFDLPNTTDATLPGPSVTWSCTAAAGSAYGSCTRQLGSATATEITGVRSATISATAADGTAIATASPTGPPGSQLPTPSGTPPQYPTSVALSISLVPISQNDRGATHAVAGAAAITLQAGVNLRNWS